MKYFVLPFALSLVLLSCQEERENTGDPLEAVPLNSVAVIESRDLFGSLLKLKNNYVYRGTDSIAVFRGYEEDLRSIASAFGGDSLEMFLRDKPFFITLNLAGAGRYDLLYIANAETIEMEKIRAKLEYKFKLTDKTYAGATVYSAEIPGMKRDLNYCEYEGLALFSTSATLVEEALRQCKAEAGIKNERGFRKLYETSNKKDDANIYFNYREAPDWIKSFTGQNSAKWLSDFAEWTEVDLTRENDRLFFSGLTYTSDSVAKFIRCFAQNDARDFRSSSIMPSNTVFWLSFQVKNFEQFHRHYLRYLETDGRDKAYEHYLEQQDIASPDDILHSIDTDWGVFYTEAASDAESNPKFAYFSSRDAQKAFDQFETWSDTNFVEGHREHLIHRLRKPYLLPHLLGKAFRNIKNPYYTRLGDFVLFSDDLPSLKGVINDVIAGKTLENNEDFRGFYSSLQSRSHIFAGFQNPGAAGLLQTVLREDGARELKSNKDQMRNIRFGGIQFSLKNEMAYTHALVLHQAESETHARQLWAIGLEAPVLGSPQLVKNHYTGRKEIFVQDANYKIYLVDGRGKILWKRQLESRILGRVHQVDRYKNGKLQLVFNTSGHIYLIDRNGDDVDGFPLELPRKSTTPMAVFDYDNARNYRFLIPCGEDIHNYTAEGKEVKGWVFEGAGSDIERRPKHFLLGNKDLIVTSEEDGIIHILDRTGKPRFAGTIRARLGENEIYMAMTKDGKDGYLVSTDKDGALLHLFFDGKSDKVELGIEEKGSDFQLFEGKYIYCGEELLLVRDDIKPFEIPLHAGEKSTPRPLVFKNEFMIGLVNYDREEIYLYNEKGELLPGFPLYAQGDFTAGDINLTGSLNLITSTDDGILINYRVE